jgi:hypothetical protein
MYIGRRNVEGGGRVASFQSDANRILVGLKGEIVANWKYDVFAQRSTVDNDLANLNYFSNANIQNALTVVPGPGGVPTCASVINGTDKKCVPWNIWIPNGVTAAATNYLQIPLLVNATTTEELVSGSATGDLGGYGLKIPLADEGVKVSFGAEWRSESAATSPDLESQLGNAAGSGGPTVPVAGGFTVKEVFTEIGIPIATHQPFADSISLDLGYRYSDYSEGFKTNTYKAGLEWATSASVAAMHARFARPTCLNCSPRRPWAWTAQPIRVRVRLSPERTIWRAALPLHSARSWVSALRNSAASVPTRQASTTVISAAIRNCSLKNRTPTRWVSCCSPTGSRTSLHRWTGLTSRSITRSAASARM